MSCRRGGAATAFDRLNKYFTINSMPVVSSQYWNQVHGNTPEEVRRDLEGLQIMRTLGRNMAWLLKCIDLGRANGIQLPPQEERVAPTLSADRSGAGAQRGLPYPGGGLGTPSRFQPPGLCPRDSAPAPASLEQFHDVTDQLLFGGLVFFDEGPLKHSYDRERVSLGHQLHRMSWVWTRALWMSAR